MDGWVDGQMGGWEVDTSKDGRMVAKWTDAMKEERVVGWKDGQVEGQKTGQEEENVGGWMAICLRGCRGRWLPTHQGRLCGQDVGFTFPASPHHPGMLREENRHK